MTTPRDKRLTALYGIDGTQYDALGAVFDGMCWICHAPVKPGGRALHLDHDHKKKGAKSVRGRTCWRCNSGLKWFRDNPGILRAAASYLESDLAQLVLDKVASGALILP